MIGVGAAVFGLLRRHAPMLAVGGLAFLLSVWLIVATLPYEPNFDSLFYAQTAQGILDGNGFVIAEGPHAGDVSAFRGPAYLLVLAGVFKVSGASYGAAQLVTAAFGAIAVMLLYLVVREIWGSRPALFAGLLGAVFPSWLMLNAGFFTEMPFVALELAVMLVLLRFRHEPGRLRLPVAAGALAGIAALTRSNGVLLLLAAVLAVWLITRADRRRALTYAAATATAGALVLAPWTIRNAIVFGEFIPTTTQSGYALFSVFNDESRKVSGEYYPQAVIDEGREIYERDLNDADLADELTAAALDYAADHPGYVAEVAALNTLRTLELVDGRFVGAGFVESFGVRPTIASTLLTPSSYLLYALAIAGVVVMLRDRRLPRPPWFFWAIPVALLMSAAFAAGAVRYRAPLDPLLLAFAGLALAALTARVKREQ